MKTIGLFLRDIFKKEFWSFTLGSKTKKWRFILVSLFVAYAIYACITDLPSVGWKIGGSAIALGWWVLNLAQFYNTYHRVKYKLGHDMNQYIKK